VLIKCRGSRAFLHAFCCIAQFRAARLESTNQLSCILQWMWLQLLVPLWVSSASTSASPFLLRWRRLKCQGMSELEMSNRYPPLSFLPTSSLRVSLLPRFFNFFSFLTLNRGTHTHTHTHTHYTSRQEAGNYKQFPSHSLTRTCSDHKRGLGTICVTTELFCTQWLPSLVFPCAFHLTRLL
jgi:hypothetical protein